jgi:Cellulase (glycosyl hydrolase family 5)
MTVKEILTTLLCITVMSTLLFSSTSTTLAQVNPTYNGLSGYVTSTGNIDKLIQLMTAEGFNIYRMGFSPPWSSNRPYNKEWIQYYLDHCNYVLVVDINHLWPGSTSYTTFENNIAACTEAALQVCRDFPNNQRVIVELVNEYYIKDRYIQYIQPMINAIRQAGYTNPLLVNKYANFDWNCVAFADSANNLIVGTHKYFNSLSTNEVASMKTHMQEALNRGYRLINTEVGAADASADFSTANTAALNELLTWCSARGIGNCVWMYENLNYWSNYQSLGLNIPPGTGSAPTPTPTPTPTPSPSPTPATTPEPTSPPSPTPAPTPVRGGSTVVISASGVISHSKGR